MFKVGDYVKLVKKQFNEDYFSLGFIETENGSEIIKRLKEKW